MVSVSSADKASLRAEIDWHAFTYEKAFVPAARAMRSPLQTNANDVPEKTNLTVE
jgi:hypothetical protein